MFGHGTFIYDPAYALTKFGNAAKVAEALESLGMSHAWLRVHNATGLWRTTENKKLADALRAAGISVGVWGWNDGNNVQADIANMQAAIDAYHPDCYIADIEHTVSGANWSASKAKTFAAAARQALGSKPLIVSSFGYIRTHQPEIMAAADPYADYFAPQIYWFWFPKPWMLSEPELSGLPTDDPAAYVTVCLHHWRKTVSKPLIVTGQAYWGEADAWTKTRAEEKLDSFLSKFDGYDEIAGLNWWNFADSKAMSAKMFEAIRAAKLNEKPYAGTVHVAGGPGPGSRAPEAAPPAAGARASRKRAQAAAAERPMIVATEDLNFRSSPQASSADNIIGTFDYAERVVTTGDAVAGGFVKAVATIEGVATTGYLHQRYLREEEPVPIERAVREAVREWHRFGKGMGVETKEPFKSYINEYWRARGYPDLDGGDEGWFWSAAYISFVLENAGYLKTKFDIRHSTYIHQSIQNRVTQTEGDFWGYRITETKPEVGDIICQWREARITYDIAEVRDRFSGHTDLVIAVRENVAVTLGGNVANATSRGKGVTVETKFYDLENGYLPGTRNVFAIMKNRHRATPEVPIA